MNAFKDWKPSDVDAHNARVQRKSVPVKFHQPIQETFALNSTRPSYKLILPFPPSNNHYLGERVVVPRNPKLKPFTHRYLTTEAKEFKERAVAIGRASGMPVLKGKILIVLDFYFPTKAGDLQNRDKVMLDVLQGVAYVNDKQVTRKEEERFDDPDNPRVEVTIQERI
jgi:Holliday junction resolvase RusA-like endonuclease